MYHELQCVETDEEFAPLAVPAATTSEVLPYPLRNELETSASPSVRVPSALKVAIPARSEDFSLPIHLER